jgi:diacylglycerol kinase family enzyme
MPRFALLANTASGSGDADRVADLLTELGATVETFAIDEWREAVSSRPERIVVAGGDGSLGCAAEAAEAAGVPLAVIPTGTANDFASRLGLPSDLEEACAIAVGGRRTRALDLARAGDRPFLNVASIGLAPAAAEEADGLKERVGALAYPAGAVKAGATATPVECTVTCAERTIHEGEAWQVTFASTGAFGGGAELEADAADGKLDVVVIEGGSRARLVKHAFGLRLGGVEGQKGVISERCSSGELRLADKDESLNVDGEVVPAAELGRDGTIAFSVAPGAFELIVS